MEGISDLDELVLKCRNESSKVYILEAVSCYRAGAYRACIVTTWIASVIDIIEKIRELQQTGNNNADNLLVEFERAQARLYSGDTNAIKNLLSFEREILLKSRDNLQLLDNHQFIELSRLQEDRNRCAHPSFQQVGTPYTPTAELARTHLKSTIIHLLSQPPIQGKAALEALKLKLYGEYYPTEIDKIKETLRHSPFNKPTDSLIRGFSDFLIISFFNLDTKAIDRKKLLYTLSAVLDLHRDIVESRIKSKINSQVDSVSDDLIWLGTAFLRIIPVSNEYLNQASRNKIIISINQGKLNHALYKNIEFGIKVPFLEQVCCERVKKLDEEELQQIIKKTRENSHSTIVDRAIEIFSKSKSWSAASKIYNSIVSPLIKLLDEKHLQVVLQSVSQKTSDLSRSDALYSFVESLYAQNELPRASIDTLLKEHKLDYLIESENGEENIDADPALKRLVSEL